MSDDVQTDEQELRLFARKASAYRSAINRVPAARAIERDVTAAMLSVVARQLGAAVIGDFMAGDGYLTEAIRSRGFGVQAYENCAEMSAGSARLAGTPIRTADTLLDLAASCGAECDVAVSLAGFHHVVRFCEGRSPPLVDAQRSRERQVETIGAILHGGRCRELLIADVAVDLSRFSGEQATRLLADDDRFGELLFGELSGNPILGFTRWPSPARWFREVVDVLSPTGHHDCFLDADLVSLLVEAGYRVEVIPLHTPWLFRDDSELRHFVADKFFLHADSGSRLRSGEWLPKLDEILGRRPFGSGVALGWGLAYMRVRR